MRLLLSLLLVCAAGPAWAHGMGNRYDLPLPLGLFAAGGALAVLLSFAVAAWFLRHRQEPGGYPRVPLVTVHPLILRAIEALSLFGFAIVLLAGFVGAANPYRNIAPVMIWVIGWVGLAFVCALAGNLWALVNPWRIAFDWAERIAGRSLSLSLPYPPALATWPAVVLFFVFAWGEINWPGSGIPSNLSAALVVYSVITWVGMTLFRRDIWLKHGEPFSIVFDLFARFAVTESEYRDGRTRLWLRPPSVAMVPRELPSFSLMVFVLLVLASVTYDGFTETEAFQVMALFLFERLQVFGSAVVPLVGTIALLGFPMVFLIVYLAFSGLIRRAGDKRVSVSRVASAFVLSLVPIAIAYHLAHYLSLLVFEGQNVIPLISDPFGFGWDLFGTANYRVDLTIMNAAFTWYFSVTAIVLGHIAAVYVAHAEALVLFPDRRRALLSQIPMVVLMVGYTMLSLWIIAQPIVA